MKIFILEDDQERLKYLREALFKHDLTVVDSCEQADQFVGPYDLLLLDHDLGGRQFEDHEDNGAAFCARIADRIGDATVVVHSYNRDGALRMLDVLPAGAVWAPFRGDAFNAIIGQLT